MPRRWFETAADPGARRRQRPPMVDRLRHRLAARRRSTRPAPTSADRPYGERDDYTSLAWLGGNAALHRLGRPADAARLFELYARAARSPQTRAKGFYWAARAASAAGQTGAGAAPGSSRRRRARTSFTASSRSSGSGARVAAAAGAAGRRSPAERAAFAAAAARRGDPLSRHDRPARRPDPVRPRARRAALRTTASARSPPSSAARSAGSTSASGRRARRATNGRRASTPAPAFPKCRSRRPMRTTGRSPTASPARKARSTATAVSHAGARGLMQLMPGTARETAGKLGVPYDLGRLTERSALQHPARHDLFRRADGRMGRQCRAGRRRLQCRRRQRPATGSRATAIRALPGADMVRWIEAIPFSETRNYVQRVLENAVVYDLDEPAAGSALRREPALLYLGQEPARARCARAMSERAQLHHARRLSARCARNMRPCSRASGRKLVETIAWAAAQWRPLREWRLSSMAASGCARSTGGSTGCRGG